MIFAYLLIVILIWAVLSLSRRLDRVEERLAIVELRGLEPAAPAPAPVERHTPPPTPVWIPTPPPLPPEPVRIAPPEPEPEPVFQVEPEPAATTGWEERIGGNLLNKLGALILVIGVALFLSYSFGNMGPGGRAFTALTLSGVLLASGAIVEQKERYRTFSRGLMAAGWAGLYFTTYAMHDLPATRIIENAAVGTALMTAVAIGMVLHSLRYRVESLTALSFGCIYAALALSTMNAFVAVALVPLALAMLYLARRFEWHFTTVFAAGATYAVFLTRPASGATLGAIQSMLVVFWLIFESFDLIRLRSGQAATEWSRALFALNSLAGLASSAALWNRMAPDSMWIFCAGAAALYLASTWLRYASQGETYYEYSLTISAVLAALAIVAGVPGLWISLGLILEAEVLYLAAHRLRIPVAKALGLVAFVAAFTHIAAGYFDATSTLPVLGTIHSGAPSLAVLAAVCYLNRYISSDETYWSYCASLFVTFLAGFETRRSDLTGIVWLAWSGLLYEFGRRKSLPEFRIQSYVVAPFAAAAMIAGLPAGSGNWMLLVAAAYAYTQALRAVPESPVLATWERNLVRSGGAPAVTLFTGLLVHRLAQPGYEAISMLVASAALLELGLRNRPRELRYSPLVMNAFGLASLFFFQIRKQPPAEMLISFGGAALLYYFFTARLLRNTNPAAVPVRSVTAVLGSVLTLITVWMIVPLGVMPYAMLALSLLMLEAGLAGAAPDLAWHGRMLAFLAVPALVYETPEAAQDRVFRNATVAAFHFFLHWRTRRSEFASTHGLLAGFVAMATLWAEVSGGMLTLSWGLEAIGLLAAGFWLRDRSLRLAGLGLLMLCIAKVFFYDLRNLETFYRILSFIGLGVILLAVSWVYTRFQEQLRRFF